MNHWTKYLPEGRRIFSREAEEINRLYAECNQFLSKLKGVKEEVLELERCLANDALKHYSVDEIIVAQKEHLAQIKNVIVNQTINQN